MYKRAIKSIDKHNILSANQYGFRAGHSTQHVVIELIDKISQAIDNNEFTIGIFLDLSKAFDTVNHDILLNKLEHYGFRGTAMQWFRNYLTNRKQIVKYKSSESKSSTTTCGVPQGSVLGPLLFLLYVNDISESSNLLSFLLFADDTNLFYSHSDPKMLNQIVNQELWKVSNWLTANKLSLNVKSHSIIFKAKNKRGKYTTNIRIKDQKIEQVTNTNFLGVNIDQNLSWKYHIKNVATKISKLTGIMARARHHLPLKTLYSAMVYPYLSPSYLSLGKLSGNSWKNTYAMYSLIRRALLRAQ